MSFVIDNRVTIRDVVCFFHEKSADVGANVSRLRSYEAQRDFFTTVQREKRRRQRIARPRTQGVYGQDVVQVT